MAILKKKFLYLRRKQFRKTPLGGCEKQQNNTNT